MDLLPLIDWVRHQTIFERSEELIKAHLQHEQKVTALEVSGGDPQKQPGQLAAFAPPRPTGQKR